MTLVSAENRAIGQPREYLGKFGLLNATKNVAINDSTPNTKASLPLTTLDILNFGIIDKIRNDGISNEIVAGVEGGTTDQLTTGPIKIVGYGIWQYCSICPIGNVVGWRLASVYNRGKPPKLDVPGSVLIPTAPHYDRYVGSQLSFGGQFSVSELSLAGLPQTIGSSLKADSGEPQPDCRNCEDYRERGDNNLVVFVALNEFSRVRTDDRDAVQEGGTVFIIIVLGGLLLVFVLYQAGSGP
jgi:hypothetical protein